MKTNRQRAVVVGGTSGLGLASAHVFNSRGIEVVLGSRKTERFSLAIAKLDGAARAEVVDVRNESSLATFFAGIGEYQYLVITASGGLADKVLREARLDDLRDFAETKLWGTLRCIQAGIATIADGGSITVVSGAVSRKGRGGALGKTIVNSALEGVTRSLAVEFAP